MRTVLRILHFIGLLLLVLPRQSDASISQSSVSLNLLNTLANTPLLIGDVLNMEIDIRLSPMDNYKSFQMIISSYSFPYSQVVKDGPFHLCKVSLNPPLQLNLLQYPILNFTSGKVQTIRLFIHELNATKHSQLKFQLNAVLGDPFPPNSNNFKVYFGVAIFTSENRHSLLLRKGMNISGNAPTRDPTVTLNLDLKSMNISKMYSYTIAGNLSLFSGAERLQVSCFVKNGFDGAVQLYSIGLTPISGSDTCNYVDFDQSTETASSVNDKVTSGLGKRIHGCSSTGEGPEIFKFGIGLSLAEGSSLPLTQFKVGVAISNRMSILEEKDVLFTIVPTGSSPLSASNTNLYESIELLGFQKICQSATISLRIHFHLPAQSFHNLTVIALNSSGIEPLNIIMSSSSHLRSVHNISSASLDNIQKMFYIENGDSSNAKMSLDILYFIKPNQSLPSYDIKFEFDGITKTKSLFESDDCAENDSFLYFYRGEPTMTFMDKGDQGVLYLEHIFPPQAISHDDYLIIVKARSFSMGELRFKEIKIIGGDCLRFMEEYAQFNSTDGPGSISLTLKVGKTCPLFNQFIPTKVLFRITYRAEIVDSDNLNLLIHAYITYNGVELIKQLITKIGRRLTKGLTMSCDSRPSSPYLRALSEETIRTNTFMVNYLIRPAMCTYGDYELTLEINNPKVCICNARLNRLGSNLMMDSMEIPGFEKNLYGHSCFSKVSIEIKKLTRIAYEGFEHQNFLTDSATLSLSVAINSKQAQTPFTINATLKTNSTWLKTLTSNFAMDLKDPQNGFTATGIVPEDSGSIYPFKIKIIDLELEVINSAVFLIVLKQNEASQVHLLHVGIGQKGENIPCVSLNSTCYGSSRNTGSGYDVCQGYNIQISTCYRKYSGEADNDKFTLKLYLTLTEHNVSSPGNIISLYININGVEYTTKLTEASTPNFCQVEDGIDIVTNYSGSSIPEAQNGVFSNVSFFLNLTAKSNCSLQVCIQSDITTTMPSMQFDQVFLLSDEDPSVLYPSLMPFQNIKGNSLACSQPNFECLKLGRLEFLQPYNDTLPYIRMKVSLRFNDANINIDDSINPIMVYIGDAITKYINVRVRRSALSDYHAHLIMNISVMDPVKTLGSGDELRVSLKLQMDPNSINEIIPISIKMNTPPLIKEIISMHSNCSEFTQKKAANKNNIWILTLNQKLLFGEILQLNLTLKIHDLELGRKGRGQIVFTPNCGEGNLFYQSVPGKTCGRVASVLFKYKSEDPINIKINMSNTCASITGVPPQGQSFDWNFNHAEMTFYKRYCLYNQAYIDLDFQQTAELRKLTLNIVEGEGDMEIYIGDDPRFWVTKYSSAVTNGLNEIIASYSVRFVRLLFMNITSKLSLKGLQWYGYVRNSSNLETCIWEDNEKKSSSMDYRVWAVDTKQDIIYFCYRSPFKRGLRCFSYNVNKKARMELPSYISALLGIQNSIVYFEDKLGQRFFSNDGVHIVFTSNKEHIDFKRINISDSSEALVWTNSDYQGDSHGISKNGKIILLWANTCLN